MAIEGGDNGEWAGLLAKDEVILWQGRPSPRLRLEFRTAFEPLFFLFFTGFSLFWMAAVSAEGGYFWTFGLLFFFVGFYSLVLVHFWKAFERSQTWYTLTSRRAIVATRVLGKRRLKTYPILPETEVELIDAPLGTVIFSKEVSTDGEGDTTVTPIGFEMIAEARAVFALIRDMQAKP